MMKEHSLSKNREEELTIHDSTYSTNQRKAKHAALSSPNEVIIRNTPRQYIFHKSKESKASSSLFLQRGNHNTPRQNIFHKPKKNKASRSLFLQRGDHNGRQNPLNMTLWQRTGHNMKKTPLRAATSPHKEKRTPTPESFKNEKLCSILFP